MRKHGIRRTGPAVVDENKFPEILSRSMSAAQIAKLLSEGFDEPIKSAVIRSHISRGAPADKRGRLRLSHYAAWLVSQLKE